MKKQRLIGIVLLLLVGNIANAQNKSIYTNLGDTYCKTIEANAEEGGSYAGICPGAAGYKLELIEGDLRQSINVIFPSGKKVNLDFFRLFGGFSSVGAKAEWRLKGNVPVALIVRLNVSENPDKPDQRTSYLIVSKIGSNTACVSAIVKASTTQNLQAQQLADAAANKPCKALE